MCLKFLLRPPLTKLTTTQNILIQQFSGGGASHSCLKAAVQPQNLCVVDVSPQVLYAEKRELVLVHINRNVRTVIDKNKEPKVQNCQNPNLTTTKPNINLDGFYMTLPSKTNNNPTQF